VETDKHLIDLVRYVEQNPLRAKLVNQAQDWQWSSLWRREQGSEKQKKLLCELPTDLPANYLDSVNTILNEADLKRVRVSVNKGTPFGSGGWTNNMVKTYGLESTTRGVGRPRQV
jgi:putative transposase